MSQRVTGVVLVGVVQVTMPTLLKKFADGSAEIRTTTCAFDSQGHAWWLVAKKTPLHDQGRHGRLARIDLVRWERNDDAIPFVVPEIGDGPRWDPVAESEPPPANDE